MGTLDSTMLLVEHCVKIQQPTQDACRAAVRPMRGILRCALLFRSRDNSSSDKFTEYFSSMFMCGFMSYNNVSLRLYHNQVEASLCWQACGD